MIIHLKKDTDKSLVDEIALENKAFVITKENHYILINSSAFKQIKGDYQDWVEEVFVFENDMQLSSKEYIDQTREMYFGSVKIGGNTGHTILIGGPCSVESRTQIIQSSEMLKQMGLTMLRGGCFKPRTSPYSFQGLGLKGLQLMSEMREKYGLSIITEVRDATHVDLVIEYADVIQIGAKAMYDQGILRACAKTHKPVMIKRGFGSTLQETVQCAEFVLSGGNDHVAICERGIRTFETKTRFTLDLTAVAWLKKHTNLPVILDPSHAMGHAYGVPDLARACVAMGVDGLLIEVHPNPKIAKSDASQQLTHEAFEELHKTLLPIATAVHRKIV